MSINVKRESYQNKTKLIRVRLQESPYNDVSENIGFDFQGK